MIKKLTISLWIIIPLVLWVYLLTKKYYHDAAMPLGWLAVMGICVVVAMVDLLWILSCIAKWIAAHPGSPANGTREQIILWCVAGGGYIVALLSSGKISVEYSNSFAIAAMLTFLVGFFVKYQRMKFTTWQYIQEHHIVIVVAAGCVLHTLRLAGSLEEKTLFLFLAMGAYLLLSYWTILQFRGDWVKLLDTEHEQMTDGGKE